ncbi:MAG: hypothetical protein HY553_09245 [Elusimicrobia bacterium]|nr:hypothetical protein [Elusimicrobiota bacterium]
MPTKPLRRLPKNTGKRWTAEETRALCRAYDRGRAIGQLMKDHRRLRGGIVARLRMSGRLPWPGAA